MTPGIARRLNSKSVAEQVLTYKPPRIAMALVLLAMFCHFAVPLQLHGPMILLAVVIGLTGFGAMIRAWWVFKRRNNAICPTSPTRVLITDDIFSRSRNPMYLGIVLMLLATAVAFGSLPFYVATLMCAAILNFVFCQYEERKLEQTFASSYATYRESTRRWI